MGDKVKYKKKLLGLDFGDIGVINSIHEPNEHNKERWASVIYPQNQNKNKVYAHSAKLTELEIVKNN